MELNAALQTSSIGLLMSRAASLLLVICLWAALYLPFLGSLELRGEEGKRGMPAVQMARDRDLSCPSSGAHWYIDKPPLVNWLVAASFRALGTCNEWTARLPSTAIVLLVAIVLVTIEPTSLGAAGSTIAAITCLTTLEVIG